MRIPQTVNGRGKYAEPEQAASKDRARPVLCEPWLDIAPDGTGTLYATDSYVAVRHPVELDDGDTPGPVPVATLKAARQGYAGGVLLNGEATAIGKDGTITAPRAEDTDPPNLAALWPDPDAEGRIVVALDPSKLLRLAKALGAVDGVVLSIDPGTLRPIHVRPTGYSGADGLLMPIKQGGAR